VSDVVVARPGSAPGEGPVSDVVVQLPGDLTPEFACERLLALPGLVLLESAAPSHRLGRWSFLCADPFLTLRARGRRIEETSAGGRRSYEGDPFEALERLLAAHAREPLAGLPPFQGGAAGFLAYDLGHHLERLPEPRYDDLALPDLVMGFYDWVVAWDHESESVTLLSTGLPAPPRLRARRAASRAGRVRQLLTASSRPAPAAAAPAAASQRAARAGVASPERPRRNPVPQLPGVASTFAVQDYLDAVARTREYILAGDIFQANLSQRLEAPWPGHAFELYRRLRRVNPAPFAAYLDIGDAALVSASPERFVRVEGGLVETRPIKGTAPRGITPMHDMALEQALRESEKDRAENVMIVDLLRNDLSRVCEDHSVRVTELCIVERYPSVLHLVSTVVGRLRPGQGAVELLRAAFPGGSITGAPKVRAMEIIAELEPTRRTAYTGAIGWLGFDGAMDSSIAIRTFIVKDRIAYFQVGGGIVVDSDPEREYAETLAKAEGMVMALGAGERAAWCC